MPPYTTNSSGRSATSGSRLFMSIRSGASVSQLFAVRCVPLAARIVLVLSVRVMNSPLSGFNEGETGFQDLFEDLARPSGMRRLVGRGPIVLVWSFKRLLHIAAAGELHLNRMHTLTRPA